MAQIAQWQPGLDGSAAAAATGLLARAEAMRSMLRELQAETEARGCPSEATHLAFTEAGFYRTLQPKLFGGLELDMVTFFKLAIAVSRGCPSTGWFLTLCAGHVLPFAACYSEQAQREVFGASGHFQAPHRPDAIGTARPVEGGYIVNGKWDYLSGVPYATHLIGGCRVLNDAAEPTVLQVVVPRRDFSVLDDWGDLLGFRGSGSNSAVVKDAFVPAHLAVDFAVLDRTQETPGTLLHGNPMYLGYLGAQYSGHLATVMVGLAQAALDEYEHILRTRRINAPSAPETAPFRYQSPEGQRDFGRALSLVDSAEGLLLHAAERHMQLCWRWRSEGVPYTAEDNLRLSAMVVHASHLAVQAMEVMVANCGTSPLRDGQRMQRYWRDISIYKAHRVANQLDAAPMLGRTHFGIPQPRLL